MVYATTHSNVVKYRRQMTVLREKQEGEARRRRNAHAMRSVAAAARKRST